MARPRLIVIGNGVVPGRKPEPLFGIASDVCDAPAFSALIFSDPLPPRT